MKSIRYPCQIWKKLELYRQIYKKYSNINNFLPHAQELIALLFSSITVWNLFTYCASTYIAIYTGLFKMIVVVQLSSVNSAPNSGNNHHLTIPFEGGMHSFKRQGVCVSRYWRYESEPPLKPSPLTCYKQFGTNSFIVLMSVESQMVHISNTCKVCNRNLECRSSK